MGTGLNIAAGLPPKTDITGVVKKRQQELLGPTSTQKPPIKFCQDCCVQVSVALAGLNIVVEETSEGVGNG